MAIARPAVTLTVTPPGGSATDYTDYLAYTGHSQQMTITQNFGRQGDTAVLPLVDEYHGTPHFRIPPMSRVRLHDATAGQTLFGGVCHTPSLMPDGPNRNEWTLNCTDYTFYADNALVRGVFNGWYTQDIIVALTGRAGCGITAQHVGQGGYVAGGPLLASFVLNYSSLSDAWKRLATLAGSVTPFGWYVDDTLNLHFYDASTALDSGVTFTTTPTAGGSVTQGHMLSDGQQAYEWDGSSIRNRILVQGASQTIKAGDPYNTAPTDAWLGDGVAQAWPLRYTVSGTPTLKVNGTEVTVTVVPGGSVATGQWNVVQNSTGSYFLSAAATPYAGTLVQVWYDYQIPVVAQANDPSSQAAYNGPNGGVYETFVSDSTLTTMPMALARAQQERAEYAFAPEQAVFDTSEDFLGWVRAGQTFTYVNKFIPDDQRGGAWGVSDTFLCVANTVTFGTGGYRQLQVTGTRV
jgi:hypothetical protein